MGSGLLSEQSGMTYFSRIGNSTENYVFQSIAMIRAFQAAYQNFARELPTEDYLATEMGAHFSRGIDLS